MTIIGYARVSTTDQNVELQEAALKAAGSEVIRSEKVAAPAPLVAQSCRRSWTS